MVFQPGKFLDCIEHAGYFKIFRGYCYDIQWRDSGPPYKCLAFFIPHLIKFEV